MKTLNELKTFCEKNGVRYELQKKMNRARFPWERTNEEDERFQVGWAFGMNNIAGRSGKSEWRSYTGIRELIQAEETIERRMRN